MREELQTYIDKIPEVAKAARLEETFWINEKKIPHGEKTITRVNPSQIEDASRRLKRFAPYLKTVFPELETTGGIIESELREIPGMKELLNNLITNAVKYNRPGGQVWVQIREQGDAMVVRVKDNGMGIPADSLDRIFERFYRVDKGRSRKQGGTGLGLSIVKHIVNFYHGTIRVTSQLDEGTEFVVTIPLNWKDL